MDEDPMIRDRSMGDYDSGGGMGGEGGEVELSAHVEHELALRLIASRAMTDETFYQALRADPRGAAEKINIHLNDRDVERLKNVNWNSVDQHLAALRREIGFDPRLRAAW